VRIVGKFPSKSPLALRKFPKHAHQHMVHIALLLAHSSDWSGGHDAPTGQRRRQRQRVLQVKIRPFPLTISILHSHIGIDGVNVMSDNGVPTFRGRMGVAGVPGPAL